MYFLSDGERRFFEALCDTIVPAGQDPVSEPGALTVGGLDYIDSALTDMPLERQNYFKKATAVLEGLCNKKYSRCFYELKVEERNVALKEMYLYPNTREMMFDLRSLALEAFYSDFRSPEYSGMTAWDYVDFGGKRISDLKRDWTFLKVWRDEKKK